MSDRQDLLRLAQRHNGCPESGRPCDEPAGCGCGMEARTEAEDRPISPAERLARHAHAGQVDKAGRPYVEHLERVVANLLRRWPDATEDEVAAAWLHDVLEDTDLTMQALLEAGIARQAAEVVWEVTRIAKRRPYLTWINALAARGSRSAIRVKLADNEDNSSPGRVAAIPCGTAMLKKRYQPARELLEKGLARVG